MSKWKKELVEKRKYEDIKNKSIHEILEEIKINNRSMSRKGEFLISLLTGSINDIEKTGIEYPETLLDKIKRKII